MPSCCSDEKEKPGGNEFTQILEPGKGFSGAFIKVPCYVYNQARPDRLPLDF